MRIGFLVNPVFDGWEPDDRRLGGTEESLVEWASELTKIGHDVEVHRNPRSSGTSTAIYKGAWYKPRQHECDADIWINVKTLDKVNDGQDFSKTLYLTNEVDATRHDLSAFASIIFPSQWAEENIPVNNPRRFILPHGYDPSKIYPGKKIPKQCLYASSPDRGLETLLRVWPKVHAAHPDATLKVTYGATEFDFPGIEFLGEVDEETMNQLYRESDVWCHPCNGGELYGITGIKAQAAGCVPVIIPAMALKETVRHGYFTDEAHYAETLIKALDEPEKRSEIRKALSKERYPDWQDSTDQLLKIIREVLH